MCITLMDRLVTTFMDIYLTSLNRALSKAKGEKYL